MSQVISDKQENANIKSSARMAELTQYTSNNRLIQYAAHLDLRARRCIFNHAPVSMQQLTHLLGANRIHRRIYV